MTKKSAEVHLLALMAGFLLAMVGTSSPAEATPAIQLPWPTGQSHRVNSGGYTYNCGTTHQGQNAYAIDFEFQVGQEVAAVARGTVSDQGDWGDERGRYLEINHQGGLKTRYLHLNDWTVTIGDVVTQGAVVGHSGRTGGVAPHLHFDLKQTDAQNPPVTSAVKPDNMSNVLDIRNGQTFGQYGACTGQASPYWTAVAPAWHGWDSWGAYADKSPAAVSYSDDRPDHTHLAWWRNENA